MKNEEDYDNEVDSLIKTNKACAEKSKEFDDALEEIEQEYESNDDVGPEVQSKLASIIEK